MQKYILMIFLSQLSYSMENEAELFEQRAKRFKEILKTIPEPERTLILIDFKREALLERKQAEVNRYLERVSNK